MSNNTRNIGGRLQLFTVASLVILVGWCAFAYAVASAETLHVVGAEGQPAYENGWKAETAGGAVAPMAFWKEANGMVQMEGCATGGTNGTSGFKLPSEDYPANSAVGLPGTGYSNASNKVEFIQVDTGGSVILTDVSGSVVCLQGQFRASGATPWSYAGPEGAEGKEGREGKEGKAGPEGKEGARGVEGPAGSTGSTGVTGVRGEKGEEGKEGKAGKSLEWLGSWSPDVTYKVLDTTLYDGSSYIDIVETPPSVTPPSTDHAHWELLAERGSEGAVGPEGMQGDQGVTGVSGAVGPTGPTGPEGPEGVEGKTGSEGKELKLTAFTGEAETTLNEVKETGELIGWCIVGTLLALALFFMVYKILKAERR